MSKPAKTAKSKTVKMKFSADQYYVTAENKDYDLGNPLYRKGEVYDIEEKMVDRWLKRGGVVVADEATDSRAQVPSKVEDKGEEQVEGKDKKEDDGGKPDTAKTDTKPEDKKGQ